MPASAKILSKIAHYYFRERLTMAQIGERLSMSRHRAGRLLREAEERGIVKIDIYEPFEGAAELERALEKGLDLKHVTVVDADGETDEAAIKQLTCNAGSELLAELVQDGDTVGIGWGSTTFDLVEAVDPIDLPETTVVQVTGGNKWLNAKFGCQEVTRRLADKFGTRPVLLHAPCIVDRPETRELLMQDSTVRETVAFYDGLDIAIVGIGSLVPAESSTLLTSDYIPREDVDALIDRGAVADVFSYFVDRNGKLVATDLYDRMITIDIEKLKKVPTSLGVASGVIKAQAVIAAVLGGFVNAIVVDSILAEAMLEELDARGISRETGSERAGQAAPTA